MTISRKISETAVYSRTVGPNDVQQPSVAFVSAATCPRKGQSLAAVRARNGVDFAGEVGRSDLPDRDACHLLCGEWHVIHAGLLAHQGLHGNDFLVKIRDHRCRARADD